MMSALCAAVAITACGGGTAGAPPASAAAAPSSVVVPPVVSAAPAPSSPATTEATATTPAPGAESAKPTAIETKESAAPAPSAEAPATPSQSPSDALTAARVAFLIDYANSDAKTKAVAACEKDPKKDDPNAKAACLQKARSQFLPDVLVFLKDKKGHVTLTIYKRNDSELKEVYIAPVAFADETPNSLRLKFKGGGSGQRPLFKNTNSPMLNMPNDYTLEIEDSEFGKLRYDAKIGLVDK